MQSKSLSLMDSEATSDSIISSQTHATCKSAIIVAGMHRSGTSVLTGVLSLLGCDISSDLIPGDEHNLKGYWESEDISSLNERMLASAGLSWNSWEPLQESWFRSGRAFEFKKEVLKLLEKNFADSELFVLKDPRISRLLPIWSAALIEFGTTPLIVMPIRDPREVAASLLTRNGLNTSTSQLIWLRYILDAEHNSRNFNRCTISYSELLSDWRAVVNEISRVSEHIVWPKTSIQAQVEISNFIDSSLRHNDGKNISFKEVQKFSPWVELAYLHMKSLSDGIIDRDRSDKLDEINRYFNEAAFNLGLPMYEHQQHGVYLYNKLQTIQSKLESATQEQHNLQGLFKEQTQHLTETVEVLQQHRMLLSDREHQMESLRKSLEAAESSISDRDNEILLLKQHVNDIENKMSECEHQSADVQMRLKECRNEVSQRNKQLSSLRQSNEVLEASLLKCEEQLQQAAKENSVHSKLYIEISKSLTARNEEFQCIAERLNALEAVLSAKNNQIRKIKTARLIVKPVVNAEVVEQSAGTN